MRLLVVALLTFGFAGCLSIDTPDGSLICADNPKRPCPEGFYCLAGANRCYRYGHFPSDMADATHWQQGGPPEDMSIPIENDLSTDDSGVPDDLSTLPDDLSDTD